MSMDGLFVHYLTIELKNTIEKAKINKIYQPNPLELILQLRKDNTTHQLLLSASLDFPRIYLTEQPYVNPAVPGNFCMLLRKYIERGIITDISQFQNDRLIEFTINTYNEMGDNVDYLLIIELMGRNSNIILLDKTSNIIVDALRKVAPGENVTRYIIPKATYEYPIQENMINPFTINEDSVPYELLQGISKLAQNELRKGNYKSINHFITQRIYPTIFKFENKVDYYCFELPSLTCESRQRFNSLSQMLDYYYINYRKPINAINNDLIKQVKRLLNHQTTKLDNLYVDLDKATANLIYKDLGILLQANLYQVKKGMKEIKVSDFLNNNDEVIIPLDPMLDPSKNLKQIFSKGKKAATALIEVNLQIEKTKEEIRYLEDILSMIGFATSNELMEIKQDLLANSEQYKAKQKNSQHKNKKKIDIQHFNFEDITIWIGKNNIQNDYLTNKLARNNDYWFHIKDGSGAHVVASVPHNLEDFTLSEAAIRLMANLAAYFSKYSNSSSVPVDYTRIKYIKKIPGSKGYHVTYTNQKTIYIDPDYELIKPYLRK